MSFLYLDNERHDPLVDAEISDGLSDFPTVPVRGTSDGLFFVLATNHIRVNLYVKSRWRDSRLALHMLFSISPTSNKLSPRRRESSPRSSLSPSPEFAPEPNRPSPQTLPAAHRERFSLRGPFAVDLLLSMAAGIDKTRQP